MSLSDEHYGPGAGDKLREVLKACQPGGTLWIQEMPSERGGVMYRIFWGPLDPEPDEPPFSDRLELEALGDTLYILFNSALCGGSPNPTLSENLVKLLPPFGRDLGFKRVVVENPIGPAFEELPHTGGYELRTYDEVPEGLDVRGIGHWFVWEL